MQFDFLKRLFGSSGPAGVKRAAPVSPRKVEVVPEPGLPGEDVLLALAQDLLIAAGALQLAARLRIRWNPRMRSTAGMAYAGKSLITLNPRLAAFPGEIERTLRHELAHLLANARAGKRRIAPHGREWRKACRDLGLVDEKRTHTLPFPRSERRRRHRYRCPSCGNEVARVIPFKTACACLPCCRAHNRGRYDPRFRFVKVA